MYIHRILENKLLDYLKYFSVIGLTGPRQSGKSTMLQQILRNQNYQYISFDDFSMVDMYNSDPKRFLRMYNNKVIFDEVQRVPSIFHAIKLAVDADRSVTGKFILTGSCQFDFVRGLSETLAGRIGLLTLLPFQFLEVPPSLREKSIFLGSYPEVIAKDYILSYDWYASYFNTYINRDVRSLSNIGDIHDFQRLIKLLAANCSQILNYSNYARELGVDVKTIKKWISILQASYIIFLLPPFFNNYGKRISKSPKIYFYDTGLISFLLGITNEQLFMHGPMTGAIFENYIIAEIMKRELHSQTYAELYYLRTSNGEEIDLIIDRKQSQEMIEIKFSETYKTKMSETIEKYAALANPSINTTSLLLYRGNSYPDTQNHRIINFMEYLTSV